MKWPQVLVLGTATFALAACQGDENAPVRPSEAPSLSVAAAAQVSAAVQGRRSRGFEDELLRMEARIPGFGGMFRDPGTGNAVVHLRATANRASAMAQLRQIAPGLNVAPPFRDLIGSDGATEIRDAEYSFSELVAWTLAVARQPRSPDVLSIDADERLNRVRISVPNDAARARVEAILARAGVPLAAVVLENRPPGRLLATVQQRVRATAGGLQIQNADSSTCTLGFNVIVEFYSEKGFLTASHCDKGSNGLGTTGDTIYQHAKPTATNRVGSVYLNPAWNSTDPSCGGVALCTDADAMFVRGFADTTSANWQQRIARTGTNYPTNNGNGSLTIDAFWTNLSKVPFVYVGEIVSKVGRSTGGTKGTVGATCEYPTYDSYAFLCVSRVDGASQGNGDSGAPVYDLPYAVGILFAGGGTSYGAGPIFRCTAGCWYHFSEWYSIETHLSRYFDP